MGALVTKPILDIPNTVMYLSIVNTEPIYINMRMDIIILFKGNLLDTGGNDLKKISLGLTSFDLAHFL